jgi:hypothetical protein
MQSHLARADALLELDEEVRIEGQATRGMGIHLRHPPADTVGVELVIPGRVEGIRCVHAPPIGLTAVICGPPFRGVPGAPG